MLTTINSADAVAGSAVQSPATAPPLSGRARLQTSWQLAKLRIKEYIQFDARMLHRFTSTAAGWTATALLAVGQYERAFKLLAKFHRGAYSQRLTERTERFIRRAYAARDPRFFAMLDRHVANVQQTPGTANFFADPLRMLGSAMLVLKSPSDGQKGVLALWYNHVMPLFAKFYDLERIAERYHLFLEPSWSGYCDLDFLVYTRLPGPVFVQAIEPHDVDFLNAIATNLRPVPCAANWWVDYRRMVPNPSVEKEFDVAMVAGWGEYKRHHRFFKGLAALRRQGRQLKVLLLGYSVGWSKDVIARHARYYGVSDQITMLEHVPYDEVNSQFNRAKVHVLWSRHEGFNRAIIEAMFAGLPCVLRDGFNYGYHYPYMNSQTGQFATEQALPTTLLEIADHWQDYSPREWVMENMTCQIATESLARTIATTLSDAEENWTGHIAVKINELHSMRYFDESLRGQFQDDYTFLATCLPHARSQVVALPHR
jgi:glycosyltransferase involved in cell wall biosynthesis